MLLDADDVFHGPHARGGEPQDIARMAMRAVMVPTHVGVNRCRRRVGSCPAHGPHARGGEPTLCGKRVTMPPMVPTHVGVNRRRSRRRHPP